MSAYIPITRSEEVDVAIVGGGFGGLCMAIRLLQEGNRDFVLLEKAKDVGGTWRENTYPGAECDVQSHLYSFSFAAKADWSQRYAGHREIQQYILDTTDAYGVRPFIRFGQEVVAARFDAARARWMLDTKDGGRIVCRHFVLASGPLHVPSIPSLPGLERFQGKVFHSAAWDHTYDLRDKNVVSIGTGGSAIQYAPEVAKVAKRLYVFQRTPAWVIPRDTRRYSALEKKAFAAVPALRKLHRIRHYWTNESRVWPIFQPALAETLQNLAKAFLRFQVDDPELVRKLTPDYTIGCKRVLISNEWYPMFNRPNVELVTEGIREIREHSVVTTDGVERPADCLVLGTGFVVDPRIYMKDFPLTGLPGHELNHDWKDGAEAYYGISVAGYPNMYQLVGPNTALGHNSIIFMIECQVHYVLECMRAMRERGADTIDVRPEAQAAFNVRIAENLRGTVWSSGCRSWYQQEGGKNFTIWPFSTWRYWLETRRVDPRQYRFERLRREDDVVRRRPVVGVA